MNAPPEHKSLTNPVEWFINLDSPEARKALPCLEKNSPKKEKK